MAGDFSQTSGVYPQRTDSAGLGGESPYTSAGTEAVRWG